MIKKGLLLLFGDKKRSLPIQHTKIRPNSKFNPYRSNVKSVVYEDNAFDGGEAKGLVGYKLNKLFKMY